MSFRFGDRSMARMRGVHPDMVKVMVLALSRSPVDFSIIEGIRTVERQKQLFDQGASKTMNSRHITGHAVDIAPYVAGQIRWDWPLYKQIAPIVKQAAKDLGIPIQWGGDWLRFKDGPHFELKRSKYP